MGLHRNFPMLVAGLVLASCESGSQPRSAADRMIELATVDREVAGPVMPDLESKQLVSSIDDHGNLLLADDQKIVLAGLDCGPKMYSYIKALFFGSEPDFLVFLPSGYRADDVQYAYIWAVSLWELGDPDLEFSPAVSSLNETGLLSGWCKPNEQDSHRYHSRSVALSKLKSR